jgi:hypothetical protein
MRILRRILAVFLAAFPTVLSTMGAPNPEVAQGWAAMQNLRFREACTLFRNSPADNRDSERSARLGEAVAMVQMQPTTREKIEKALVILDRLIREAPESEISIQAAYLKARIIQLHPFDPDPAVAIPLYLDLAEQHPETLLGQFAFVKASALRLYNPDIADDERPFEAISTDAALLSDPDVLRCYHLMMAEASQRLGYDDAFSLRHYRKAYDAGLTKPDLRANVLARIILLAQRLGDRKTALSRARVFLTEFPRDIRTTVMEELVKKLDGADS